MKKIFMTFAFLIAGSGLFAEDPPACTTPEACESACEKKDNVGCYRLARMYAKGLGVKIAPKKALKYYDLACEYGSGYHCLLMSWAIQYDDKLTDDNAIIEHFRMRACVRGEARGCKPMTVGEPSSGGSDGSGLTSKIPPPPPPAPPPVLPNPAPLPCEDLHEAANSTAGKSVQKQIFNAWDVEEPPKLLKRTDPQYPEKERSNRHEGKVFMELDVDETGKVIAVRTLRSDSMLFEESAKEAVMQWRYSPARHCGKNVSTHKNVSVVFTLH